MTDEFDEELGNALRARSGGPVGTTLAHEAVLGRAASIRRRRAVTAGSGALAVLVVGALVLVSRGGDDRIAPADEVTVPSVDTIDVDDDMDMDIDEDASPALPTTIADDDRDAPSTTPSTTTPTSTMPTSTIAASTSTTAAPGGALTTVAGATPSPAAPSTVATTAATPPAATPSTTTPSTTTPSTTTPSTTATTAPTTTAADPPATPPFTKTYNSSGGSITVDWNGASLSLLSVQPVSGYTAEVEDQTASRIRVRFRGAGDSRIEIRAVNGQVQEIIS